MSGYAFRSLAVLISAVLAAPMSGMAQGAASAPAPTDLSAQVGTPPANAAPEVYTQEQLDALMASVALYPDTLLTQIMMASTFPVEVMQARVWLDNPANKALQGDAIAKALETQNWDPSVKSLVLFPQIVVMMADKADWMQQLGYAVSVQQTDVLDSVQRLRRQAQQAGSLTTTPQQTVTMAAASLPGAPPVIVVQPADPRVVYVPSYNPTQVYGVWPYPATPPVYLPPPPGYAIGSALVTGMAFAAGVAVVGSLWNIGRPNWGYHGGYGGYGGVNVNTARYNSVNVNRTQISNSNWRAPPNGGYNRPGGSAAGGGRPMRPPSGPVGMPGHANGLPANAIGRPSVSVPGGVVNRPPKPPGLPGGGATRPNPPGGAGANRPNAPGGRSGRPSLPNGGGAVQRPAAPARPEAAQRPAARPAPSPAALGGMREGRQAPAYANRGAQSRNMGGGGARPAGGGGGGGGRGGGGRRH